MVKKLLFILLFIPAILIAQNTIKGTFSPASDYEWVILYKVTPTHSNYVADAKLNEEGTFEITLDSTHTQGMYRIVYAVPQDEFNFDIIYNAKENIEFTFNSETGIKFQASVENNLLTSYTNSMSMVSQSVGNFYRQQSTDSTALKDIFETLRTTQVQFEKIADGTIANTFIKANRPYIPDDYIEVGAYIDGLKDQFFDNVDFNDELLQSSNFLVDRVLNYVFGMSSKANSGIEGYKMNIDKVVSEMQDATIETKKMLLGILWQQLSDANYESVANHVTDNYLLDIAKKLNDQELIDMLVQYRNVSLGNVAPDFDIEMLENKKKITKKFLEYNVAEQYVLVFWSSMCSHCLEELPQLHELIDTMEEGKLKVIAFGLEDDEYRWKSETYNMPKFTHVIGLGKWENKVGNAYNVTATPTYFVLDKEKRILAKPTNINDLKKFLKE